MSPASHDILDGCASAALRSIQENGLQVEPQSFSVWYEYHRGGNADLRRLIDIIRSNRSAVTAEAVAKIYARFIANPRDHEELRATADRMQQTLMQISALVVEAGADAGRFGAAVRSASGSFAAEKASIGELVARLLAEAREVAARAGRIEGELARNAEMIRTIQHTLQDSRDAALTDPLTGLPNRRQLEEAMQLAAAVAMDDGAPLSLLLLDVDHVERIARRGGEAVRDQVLQLAATAIRASLRPVDVAARLEGATFAVLLPGATLAHAAAVGERIREAFAAHRMVARASNEGLGMLSFSLGAAGYDVGEKLAVWMRRADAALAEVKASRRG